MSEQPRISIVLPVYNGARYVTLAIESILAQDEPNWELICVDDCSTDATPQILADYAARDPRIHAIRHEVNKKLPGALNTGFALARAEYLTWTSDDNMYRPHALARMATALDAQPHVDLVYAGYSTIDGVGGVGELRLPLPPRALVYKSVVGACFLYRRAVHEALQAYDESLFLVEDYDFWLRASMRFHLQPLAEDLYLYREHEGTLTTQRRAQVLALRAALIERHLPALPWADADDRALAYLHLREQALALDDTASAQRYLRSAWQHSPLRVLRWHLRAAMQRVFGRGVVQALARLLPSGAA